MGDILFTQQVVGREKKTMYVSDGIRKSACLSALDPRVLLESFAGYLLGAKRGIGLSKSSGEEL